LVLKKLIAGMMETVQMYLAKQDKMPYCLVIAQFAQPISMIMIQIPFTAQVPAIVRRVIGVEVCVRLKRQ
jgi:hypothetical protein